MEAIAELTNKNHSPNGIDQYVKKLTEKNKRITKINKKLVDQISKIGKQNKVLTNKQKEILINYASITEHKEEVLLTNKYLKELADAHSILLNTQEKQLDEYAFINSHLLRGPVVTLKGLLNLMSLSKLSKEEENVHNYMHDTVQKLDNIVLKISAALSTSKHVYRNILQ